MKPCLCAVAMLGVLGACSRLTPNDPQPSRDDQLRAMLIGEWSRGALFTVQFLEDSKFIQWISVQDSTISIDPILWLKAYGDYEVKDGILYYGQFTVELVDSTVREGGYSFVPTGEQIDLSDSNLELHSVDVFKPVNASTDSLWGSWYLTRWVYHRTRAGEEYGGQQRETYTFYRDSSHFDYEWVRLYANPWPDPHFQSDFRLDSAGLDLFGPGSYDINLVFSHGLMYWYYSSTETFQRVQ